MNLKILKSNYIVIIKMKNFTKKIVDSYLIKFLKKVPGEKRFGLYRFLPIFFIFGASLEYLMIHLKAGPNQVNFCKKFKNINKHKFNRVII